MFRFYHLVLADFRERTRRYSFLLTLCASLYLAYAVYVGNFTARFGDYRGINNSAWVGSNVALSCTLLLVIIGFYLVNNSIRRDRETGVGQILAATPLSRYGYVAVKFISNFVVLGAIVIILILTAMVLQLVDPDAGRLEFWPMVAPFLFLSIPAITLVSSLAVLFESTRWLRGTFGNVLYFLASVASLPLGSESGIRLLDLTGLAIFEPSMRAALQAAHPGIKTGFQLNPGGWSGVQYFEWTGIDWTTDLFVEKTFWVGVACVLTVPAAMFFNRFDPSKEKRARAASKKTKSSAAGAGDTGSMRQTYSVRQLVTVRPGFSFVQMVLSELRLMLKGRHRLWYLVALGLIVAGIAAPFDIVRGILMPIAWIWPIMIWSSMGTRERRFNTGPLVYSSPYPVTRQFPATWAAGVIATMLLGSGAAIQAAVAGNGAYLTIWLVGALFIPTLALALGTLTGSNKLFEVIYVTLWYIGPLNRLPYCDYMGASGDVSGMITLVFFIATLLLLPIAFVARRQSVFSN